MQNELKKFRDYFASSEYVDEFNNASFVLQHRSMPVSTYLELNENHIKTPLTDDNILRYALNHPFDLLAIIRKNDNNVYIDEALMSTWKSDATIKHFKSVFKKIVPEELQDITFEDLYDKPNNHGKLIDYFKFGPTNDDLIAFVFPFYIEETSQHLIKKFVDAMYVSGYFLSLAENASFTKKMKDLNVGLCFMQFEARYSRKTFDLSKYLYHISPSRYFNKIMKNGLIPSSKLSFLRYPDRIYLFNTTDFETIKSYGVVKSMQLLSHSNQWINDDTFVIFAIDSKKLMNHHLFKDKKMVFYIDPCYDGKVGGIQMHEAIYTYSNIPRELIENKCFVYSINKDDNGKININFDHMKTI